MTLLSTLDNCSVNGFRAGSGIYQLIANVLPSDSSSEDKFGKDVVLNSSGSLLFATSYKIISGNVSGNVYIFSNSNDIFTEIQKITTPANCKNFGHTINCIDSGNTIFVSAVGDNTIPGKVFIYNRSGNIWNLSQTLTPSDSSNDDNFGSSISVTADGNYCAIGAPNKSAGSPLQSGAGVAYVFTKSGNNYVQQQQLTAVNNGINYSFGTSIALSNDANYCFVGQPGANNVGGSTVRIGVIQLFARANTSWTRLQWLTAGTRADQQATKSIACNNDGTKVFITAQNQPDDLITFTRTGNTFSKTNTLNLPSYANTVNWGNINLCDCDDIYGNPIAGLQLAGQVIVATNATSTNLQIEQIIDDQVSNIDTKSIAISSDGKYIAQGSMNTTVGANPGIVYVYRND